MARPNRKLEKFVELYCEGSAACRGDWEKSAYGAGMSKPPDRNDPMVQRMIADRGGVTATPEMVRPPKVEPPVAPLAGLENLPLLAEGGLPWRMMRDALKDVIVSVASGTVKATASQVAMLKEIIKKAEEQAAEEDEVRYVVVLPTQGSGAEMRIDEQWFQKIKAMETPADEQV